MESFPPAGWLHTAVRPWRSSPKVRESVLTNRRLSVRASVPPGVPAPAGTSQSHRSVPSVSDRASTLSPFTTYRALPATDTIPLNWSLRSHRTERVARSKTTRRLLCVARMSLVAPRTGAVFMLHPFQLKLESGIAYSATPLLALLAVTLGE